MSLWETEATVMAMLPHTELKEAVEGLVLSSIFDSEHILPCLQKLEDSLMKMNPSKSKDTQNVLGCVIQALVAKELLHHQDLHVRVSVASCFCHILRMMTPEDFGWVISAFDNISDTSRDVQFGRDELLREILGLVVSAFDNISDTSSGLYDKQIAILKTFAKARLFMLLVDLECDELIVNMFKCFLGNISETQRDAVFSSMGLIMIMTVIKMKHIPFNLTLNLLQTVRNGYKDVSPVARELAERVLQNCDLKLAPCLSEAVEQLGFPFHDYSRTVARVCARRLESQTMTEVVGSGDDASEKNVGINKPDYSKMNPDASEFVTPRKSIESNAVKRRGGQNGGSSTTSCVDAVKIRVKIPNDSAAKLNNAASSCPLPATNAHNVSARKVCSPTNGMQKGSSSKDDGSKKEAMADSPGSQARNPRSTTEELPLNVLLHRNIKRARYNGRKQPRIVMAELPDRPEAAGEKSLASVK